MIGDAIQGLHIAQWNAHCLIHHIDEFQNYIYKLKENRHVICFQATWFKDENCKSCHDYNGFLFIRNTGPKGGCAIFIQNDGGKSSLY